MAVAFLFARVLDRPERNRYKRNRTSLGPRPGARDLCDAVVWLVRHSVGLWFTFLGFGFHGQVGWHDECFGSVSTHTCLQVALMSTADYSTHTRAHTHNLRDNRPKQPLCREILHSLENCLNLSYPRCTRKHWRREEAASLLMGSSAMNNIICYIQSFSIFTLL